MNIKLNEDESEVVVLGRKEGLVCEVRGYLSMSQRYKNLLFVLNESGIYTYICVYLCVLNLGINAFENPPSRDY